MIECKVNFISYLQLILIVNLIIQIYVQKITD